MFIHQEEDRYKVLIYKKDLIDLGQNIGEIIDNLIEASSLTNIELTAYQIKEDMCNDSWVIYFYKEN